MENPWRSCFLFAYRYTYLSFLPPFVSFTKYKLEYFTVFCSAVYFLRVVLLIPFENKTDYEIYFTAIRVGQMFFNTVSFAFKRKDFLKFENDVNDFLKRNKTNPVDPNGELFFNMWNKEKPVKFAKYFSWSIILPGIGWLFLLYSKMILDAKNLTRSPTPFYSPWFADSLVNKWLYCCLDTVMIVTLVAQVIHSDLVITVLLSFMRCKFLYLKYLLNTIFDKNFERRTDDVNRKWIQLHRQVFHLWNDLNLLLRPHITINYLSQVGVVVFNILALMESNTNQSFIQKAFINLGLISLLFVLGYQCGIVEEIIEIHSYMYRSLLRAEIIQGKKKESFFLKMLMLRCQRPIRISGYGLFYMSTQDYKELVLNIYKFYSSLVSVKTKQGKLQN